MKDELASKTITSYIKKAVIAIIISVLLSSAGLIIAPIYMYTLLYMGVTAFPFWIATFIIYGTVTIITGVPGIYANIYLTRKIPLSYRVAAIIFYIVIFTPIARELFLWGFWHGSR